MRFVATTLLDNSPDPLTGEQLSTHQRYEWLVQRAKWVEDLGFDAIGVGERHAQRFVSSSPPVLLAAIAASTSRIRLMTTVTVLSLLDPVRVAEDYATLDQLSGGRVDIVIGKGNDPDQNALFGYDLDGQWERNAEKYELLRRLLREEDVTWSGRFRPPLSGATTQPRPFQQSAIPIWHGSASSPLSTELAAIWGEPIFSANAFHPMAKYAELVRHYRERWEAHGHDPEQAQVAAGFNGLLVAATSQEALAAYEPVFEAFKRSPGAAHNQLPFSTVREFVDHGSALVGSPEQVVDKLGRYHEAFGHELTGVPLDLPGLPEREFKASFESFVGEVVPQVRATHPSRAWPAQERIATPSRQ